MRGIVVGEEGTGVRFFEGFVGGVNWVGRGEGGELDGGGIMVFD